MTDEKVGEIMTDKLETVEADTTAHEVMNIMAARKIGSVLVKPKDVDDIPGVISVRDLVYKVLAKDLEPKKIKAIDIATKPLICVNKDMRIEHAVKLMGALNINRVFIKNGEEIVGVVALSDIIKSALKE